MEVLQNLLSKDSETLAEVAQRSGRCPVSGNIQGQVGWGYGQPDGVEDVPADCGGGWARWPLKVPSKPNYSMKDTFLLCYA